MVKTQIHCSNLSPAPRREEQETCFWPPFPCFTTFRANRSKKAHLSKLSKLSIGINDCQVMHAMHMLRQVSELGKG